MTRSLGYYEHGCQDAISLRFWEYELGLAGFVRFGTGSSVGGAQDIGRESWDCNASFVRAEFSLWYRGERAGLWLERYFASEENQAQSRQTAPSRNIAREFAPIILAQSDTTAGFLSRDKRRLNRVKGRQEQQEILRTFVSFAALAQFTRIPIIHKHFVRRTSKTSFVLSPQKAFRVVKNQCHAEFLRHFGWLYSTSANAHRQKFSLEFALKHADIVVLDSRGICESKPSKMFKLSRYAKAPLRV